MSEAISNYVVTVPPAARVVQPALLRTQSRIDTDPIMSGVTDDYLGLLIDAATEAAEVALYSSLVPRTIAATFRTQSVAFYPFARLDLPRGPVIEIISVTDSAGATITTYELEHVGFVDRVKLTASASFPLTVTYRAGYVAQDNATAAVPSDLTLAILTHAATLYENRESVSEKAKTPMPHGLEMFYAAKRRDTGAA